MAAALANTSSQGSADTALIAQKIAVAHLFSAAVPGAAYRGQTAATTARNLLRLVASDTDLAAFQPTIDDAIEGIKRQNVATFQATTVERTAVPTAAASP